MNQPKIGQMMPPNFRSRTSYQARNVKENIKEKFEPKIKIRDNFDWLQIARIAILLLADSMAETKVFEELKTKVAKQMDAFAEKKFASFQAAMRTEVKKDEEFIKRIFNLLKSKNRGLEE